MRIIQTQLVKINKNMQSSGKMVNLLLNHITYGKLKIKLSEAEAENQSNK